MAISSTSGTTHKLSGSKAEKDAKPLAAMRAERYTLEAWFPVNPQVIKTIRKNIKENTYHTPHQLIDDIKKDFALFTYCLRQLGEASPKKDSSDTLSSRLKSLQLADLKALVPISETRVSSHKFANTNEVQARQWRQLTIVSSAAQALAHGYRIDSNTAFLAAVLRQLGLTLISWNYPRIYERVLQYQFAGDQELEGALAEILGFAPTLLGVEIAKKLGVDDLILDIMQSRSGAVQARQSAPVVEAIQKIHPDTEAFLKVCELAESLARVYDPDHFPNARAQLDRIKADVIAAMGPSGMQTIEEEITSSWAVLMPSLPERVNQPLSQNPAKKVVLSRFTSVLFNRNPFIKNCSKLIQDRFVNVYANMLEGQVSATSLKILLTDLIPLAGFDVGCIYQADPARSVMVPKMMIGNVPQVNFKPVFQSAIGMIADPLALAHMSSTPIKGQATSPSGEEVAYLAGSIGRGILYLETKRLSLGADNDASLISFKAIRECLCEALNISGRKNVEIQSSHE